MEKMMKRNVEVNVKEAEYDQLSPIKDCTILTKEFDKFNQGIDEKNGKSILIKRPHDTPEGMSFAGVINCEENTFYPYNAPSKEETKNVKEPKFRLNILKRKASLVEDKKDEKDDNVPPKSNQRKKSSCLVKDKKEDGNEAPFDTKMQFSQLLRMVLKAPWKIIESNNLNLIYPGIGSKPLTEIVISFPAKFDVYLNDSLIGANHPFWNKCTEVKLYNKQLRVAYILQVLDCVQQWIKEEGYKIIKRDWKNRVMNYVYEQLQDYRNRALRSNENDYLSYLFRMKTKEKLILMGIQQTVNGKFHATRHFKELGFLNLYWNDIREIFCEDINYGPYSSGRKLVTRFETTNRIINKWNEIIKASDILTITPWPNQKQELPVHAMRLELRKNVGKIQKIRRNLKENCKFFNCMYTEAFPVDDENDKQNG